MEHYSKDSLLKYFFKELERPALEKVSRHLENCEECKQYIADLEATNYQLNSLGNASPEENSFTSILTAIEIASNHEKSKMEITPRWPYLTMGLSVLLLFSIAFIFNQWLIPMLQLETLSQLDFWNNLGSLSKSVVIIMTGGVIITLASARILRIEADNSGLNT